MSRLCRVTTYVLCLAAPVCSAGLPAQTNALPNGSIVVASRADTVPLRRTLDSLARRFHGVLGYSINNLDTGERLALRGDETFPTASLIKVSILVTLYDLADKGMISLDDPLSLLKIDQVPGSGVLQF